MPLDHTNGEHIQGLGVGQIAQISKWADTPFFEVACDHAERAFIKAGALLPVEFDNQEILVMEYPARDRLAFLFCKHIAGQERLVPFVIKLDPPVISELVLTGRWTRPN